MALLARAQSLSGRPGDALVMLRRLADMGAPLDVRESNDFARVRALSGWPELEARIVAALESRPPAPVEAPAKTPAPAPARPAAADTRPPIAPTPPSIARTPPPSARAETAAAPVVDAEGGEEALALTETALEPVGLAYDGASRRFVVADRRANKLIVADEVFKRVNDLIGAESAGFGTLSAIEIDTRRGDLWVTSGAAGGPASLHKLQLVSGRVLDTIALPPDAQPASFADVAMIDGTVLVLDSIGARLLTLDAGKRTFGQATRLAVTAPESVAAAGDVLFIAHDGGLSRTEWKSGRTQRVGAGRGVNLKGLRRIRWNGGALVALQTDEDSGRERLVRIRLSRGGTAATAVQALDNQRPSIGPALTIWRDAAYYVARSENGPVIRRVLLR